MSGILDQKTSLLDYKITENGREQISNGDIRIEYASLSDRSIVYEKDFDKSLSNRSEISNTDNFILFEVDTKTLSNINNEFNLDSSFTFTDSNILSREIDVTGDNTITFKSASDIFVQNNSTGTNLKNLKTIGNRNYVKGSGLDFVEKTYENFDFDFFNKDFIENYLTIKSLYVTHGKLKSIVTDKRFSHKTNFKKLIPVGINNEKIYEDDNDVDDKITIDYIFKNSRLVDYSKVKNKTDLINQAINSLNSKENLVLKREYFIKEKSDFDSFIFNMYEENSSSDKIEKLSIIDLGKNFDESNVSKHIFLIGKLINTKNDSKELDEIYKFKEGVIQRNTTNKNFAVSAYYSFVCMFTIVVE